MALKLRLRNTADFGSVFYLLSLLNRTFYHLSDVKFAHVDQGKNDINNKLQAKKAHACITCLLQTEQEAHHRVGRGETRTT